MKRDPERRTSSGSGSYPEIGAEDVREIRYRLRQSQSEFAEMIGVSLTTLQAWEDGRHHPDGAARALLRVASKNPKTVAKALGH